MLLIEGLLVLLAVAAAFVFPTLGSHWFEMLEKGFARLASHRRLAVVGVGLLALVVRAALLPILPVPEPAVHDEFANLLAADTFARGRLTNPTHPMWIHFETFHVIWKPTYASKYPPAQGLVLAAGQVIGRHPFWGVWFSVGLMCAAICWMLQGWLPAEWALLGGIFVLIRLGTFSYWADSYFGGAIAATGGSLVLGALPRIKASPRVRDTLLMGLGLVILANSRPYEGLVLSVPVMAALLVWMLKKSRPAWRLAARSVLAPLVAVLALTGGAMGFYFWRVTGNPFRMPYQVYQDAYDPTPAFLWQSARTPPTYRHKVIEDFYLNWELPQYEHARSLSGVVATETVKVGGIWMFYLGVVLVFPLLMALAVVPYPFSWSDVSRPTRFLILACGVSLAGLVPEVYFNPHYAAPATCLVVALVLLAMRHLRAWRWRSRATGLFMTRAVLLICVVMLLIRAQARRLGVPLSGPATQTWCSPPDEDLDRAHVLAELQGRPGRHLVIVRYSEHNIHREWVYNEADIDDAKVVWARDMGPAMNEELIRYFKDRQVWLVQHDENPPYYRIDAIEVPAPRDAPGTSKSTP